MIGGTVAINAPVSTVQGGTNDPAIEINGNAASLTFAASNNGVLAGAGSPAIVDIAVKGGNTSQLKFGNGNNNIQGAAGDKGKYSAMTIVGPVNVTFGNGNTIFGGPTVTANVPAVNDDAGFLAGSGLGLTLGSGTFQFMEGLSVTGGDLTLNPPATTGGVGYYIMDGGSNGGLNMTFGDLNATNATIGTYRQRIRLRKFKFQRRRRHGNYGANGGEHGGDRHFPGPQRTGGQYQHGVWHQFR